MESRGRLIRTFFTMPTWLVYATLLLAPHAEAAWTLVQADVTATAIHETGLYRADVGQRFAFADMVETPSGGGVQIQDDAGNRVALGHDTRVLLMRDGHIALLRGWLKASHACAADTQHCVAPVIESPRTTFTIGENSALVVSLADTGYRDDGEAFCETGTSAVLAVEGTSGKTATVRLDAHHFAMRTETGNTVVVSMRTDPAFLAAMPVAFRDSLPMLPLPAHIRNDPPAGMRPVDYDDVSDWLDSALAARNDPSTRFTSRFRARLSDPTFRRAITQNLRELHDWRPLIYPPTPRAVPRNTGSLPGSVYPSYLVRQ